MDDLIRRSDAKRIVSRDGKYWGLVNNDVLFKMWTDVDEIKPAQQWIPCSERLPKEEGQYLVTLDFAWGKEIELGDWFIFEDGHGEWVNPNSHVTVAWMELPTPWKSEVE